MIWDTRHRDGEGTGDGVEKRPPKPNKTAHFMKKLYVPGGKKSLCPLRSLWLNTLKNLQDRPP